MPTPSDAPAGPEPVEVAGSTAVAPMLEVIDLETGHGRVVVSRHVSLTVDAGEAVGLLGANGAGKSTLLNTLGGLLPARLGTATLRGEPILKLPIHRRRASGVALVREGHRMFAGLSVDETLLLAARSNGIHRALVRERLDELYAQLPQLADRRAASSSVLSGGEQQLLAIARAIVVEPAILLLDEPYLGLSPASREKVSAMVRRLRESGMAMIVADETQAGLDEIGASRVCEVQMWSAA